MIETTITFMTICIAELSRLSDQVTNSCCCELDNTKEGNKQTLKLFCYSSFAFCNSHSISCILVIQKNKNEINTNFISVLVCNHLCCKLLNVD